MIAAGCIMARICHTNNCPVGVATQREDLRAKFPGTPADVVNYFAFVAGEVRSLLAELGYRSLDELVGRADLLKTREGVSLAKTKGMDLAFLTNLPDTSADRSWLQREKVHGNGPMLDDDLLQDESLGQAIKTQVPPPTTFLLPSWPRESAAYPVLVG